MTGGEREDSLLVTGTWKARTRVGGIVIRYNNLKKKKKKAKLENERNKWLRS